METVFPFILEGLLRDTPDVNRFPTMHMAKAHFLLENLKIPEPSLGRSILGKFQRRN